MRAAVYYNNRDVRIEEVPRPEAGPGEILVRVMASGICGSDVLEWYRTKSAPRILGHEIAGEIVEAGAGVEGLAPGQRVFVSHHVPCDSCIYCKAGKHTVCETLHTTNFDPGGFAEYVRAPSINVQKGTLVLPKDMSFETATFIEPLGCVLRGQRVAGFERGRSVAVLGSGISGLLHIMLAKYGGASSIVATDVNDFRMSKAEEYGADLVIQAREDIPAAVRAQNGGRGADLVIVCTGAPPAFEQALQCVDRGGTVMCFATTEPGVDLAVPINEFWRNSVTVMSSYAAAPADLCEAMDLLEHDGLSGVESMITHRLPLADTAEGFRLVAEAGNSIKVIIEPQK